MSIEFRVNEDGSFTSNVATLVKGLDSQSAPTTLPTGYVPEIQNLTTNPGSITGIGGATLHTAGFVAPDLNPQLMLAQYRPLTGTDDYIQACQDGTGLCEHR